MALTSDGSAWSDSPPAPSQKSKSPRKPAAQPSRKKAGAGTGARSNRGGAGAGGRKKGRLAPNGKGASRTAQAGAKAPKAAARKSRKPDAEAERLAARAFDVGMFRDSKPTRLLPLKLSKGAHAHGAAPRAVSLWSDAACRGCAFARVRVSACP